MLIKIECIDEDAAKWAESNWPDEIIRQGKSVICLNIPSDELAYIQQQTRAHTMELSKEDESLVCDKTLELMAED